LVVRKACKERQVWEEHWKKLNQTNSIFGKICEAYRRLIISNAVAYYLKRYFPTKGIFVECGSGTSQTLSRLKKEERKLVALDIAITPLKIAKKENIDEAICADIFNLPFKDDSIDGIWNLGVMEHFYPKDTNKILDEFHRVLKKGARVILFWLPSFSSTQIVLRPIEIVVSRLSKEKFNFFPDEVTKISSFKHAKSLIDHKKFKLVNIHFNHKDLFTYLVMVYEKK